MADNVAELSRLRVLRLDKTARACELIGRWRYYEQTQHDDAAHEFDGRQREPGLTYFAEAQRQRALGFTPMEIASVPFSRRRPSCPTTVAGVIVDTYTAMLLGEGRQPSIQVSGDPASTDLLAAMFEASDTWDAVAEARDIAGAEGAVAMLPELNDGALTLRALRPEQLFIKWSAKAGLIPEYVIEQKLIEVESRNDDGLVVCCKKWRTRAWDEKFSYIYHDVDEHHGEDADPGDTDADVIELAEDPIEHKAGRCPVVWHQNTRCTDDPIGKPDCEGVFEHIDRLDYLLSMILRGTTANNDPTLVIADRLAERRMWPFRAKGHGNKIEVSEVGSAALLQYDGKTIETSWLTAREIKDAIEQRTGVVIIRPDQAGALQSGVALQILRGTANNRVSARRPSLSRTLIQLGGVYLALAKTHGVKEAGTEGKGIALALREVPAEKQGDQPTFELPKLGKGKAVLVRWGELHAPTPSDLTALAQSMTVATGGRAVVSQETGVAVFAAQAQTGIDPSTEMSRIQSEREEHVASFESSMKPGADGELEGAIEGAKGIEAESGDAPDGTKVKPGATKDIQAMALNGAQVTAFLELMSATGDTIAPEVSARFQTRAFQIPAEEAKANVDAQMKFIKDKPKPEAPPMPVPGSPVPKPPRVAQPGADAEG